MNRIEQLRERVLHEDLFSNEFQYLFFKTYHEMADHPLYERYAAAFEAMMTGLTPSIWDGELIVGKYNVPMSDEAFAEWRDTYYALAEHYRTGDGGFCGQDSHMTVDYVLVLEQGLTGILAQIDRYEQTCDEDKKPFYAACRRCVNAAIAHAERYAEEAERLAAETADTARRAELTRIAAICRKVPAQPADSFYEAVQSVHFISHVLSLDPFRGSQQFQLGRIDQYLLPYYERDIASGALTKEYAQLLLDCLGIQINMRVPHGLSSGYMVGGRDADGHIVANDLTEMGMQVIDDIRLVYPAVGLCYTKGMDETYLRQACALLAKGYSHPAIFGDDVITEGLKHYGVPENEAHSYIHSTCVEITPIATSNVWVASPYTNMAQLLLDVMDREYDRFDDLVAALLAHLDERIRANFEEQKGYRALRKTNRVHPFLSCLVNDCLARGLDIERGGARYNWIMPSFVGMANLVDSLYAIKRLVFDDQSMTMAALKAMVDQNFAENEPLRQHILHHIPKYGNDTDEVDGYFQMLTSHIVEVCRQYRDEFPNGNLIPSVFCWVMHDRFGRETSATPDGRPANFPLGDGSGPCQGREMNGPTASVLSATKWDHTDFIGGVAVNLKFSKAALGADSLDVMTSIVKTYLNRGGFEIQINVVDNAVLKEAQQHPDQYRDLVVRIGGYSDYFVTLSPTMQEEVILRTAHHV